MRVLAQVRGFCNFFAESAPIIGLVVPLLMKVCPKCHSTFTDETLSFCLTDGTPLVHQNLSSDNISHEFSNANTIFDSDSTLFNSVSHTTDPQSYQQTQYLTSTQLPAAKSSKTRLYIGLTSVVVLLLVGGGLFWLFRDNFRQMYDPPHEVIKSSEARQTVSPLTLEQDAQIKKEINDFLMGWKAAIEKRDINEQMRFYAKTVETFYRDSDKDQNSVRAERLKAIERFDTLNLELDHITVTPESDRFAKAVFDKTWVFRGKDRFSSGGVQQEMGLVKSNNRWFIVIEKDLQIYNMNNRQNTHNHDANSNAPSNTNVNR